MNLPAALLAIGWMIRDTIRQSLASRLFWAMFALSTICILFCLSVGVKDHKRLPTEPGEAPYVVPKSDPQVRKLGVEGARHRAAKVMAVGIEALEPLLPKAEPLVALGQYTVRRDR